MLKVYNVCFRTHLTKVSNIDSLTVHMQGDFLSVTHEIGNIAGTSEPNCLKCVRLDTDLYQNQKNVKLKSKFKMDFEVIIRPQWTSNGAASLACLI